jgi:hypothetical protein
VAVQLTGSSLCSVEPVTSRHGEGVRGRQYGSTRWSIDYVGTTRNTAEGMPPGNTSPSRRHVSVPRRIFCRPTLVRTYPRTADERRAKTVRRRGVDLARGGCHRLDSEFVGAARVFPQDGTEEESRVGFELRSLVPTSRGVSLLAVAADLAHGLRERYGARMGQSSTPFASGRASRRSTSRLQACRSFYVAFRGRPHVVESDDLDDRRLER